MEAVLKLIELPVNKCSVTLGIAVSYPQVASWLSPRILDLDCYSCDVTCWLPCDLLAELFSDCL